jgi:hypothetical protein
MLEPPWLPPLWLGIDEDWPPLRPPEEDCDPPLDPPPPDGMLEGIDELRPPPEEPPPEGEGIPDEGEEGIDEEEDC